MDVNLAKNYGWKSKVDLKKAILSTYNSYKSNEEYSN